MKNNYSILLLSTCFLINTSIYASQPNQPESTPLLKANISRGSSVYRNKQKAIAIASSIHAPSEPQATTEEKASEQPNENQTPAVKKLSKNDFSRFVNWWNGTDTTLTQVLQELPKGQEVDTTSAEAQSIIASAVANFMRKKEPENIIYFMKLVKEHKVKLDQAARQELRSFLAVYEEEQEKNLKAEFAKRAEDIKSKFEADTISMLETKKARTFTYQGDSEDEEEVRTYHIKEDLVTKNPLVVMIPVKKEKNL